MKKTISVLLIFCTILGLLVFPIDSVAESNDPKGPSDKVTDILWYSPTGKGKMFITNGIGYRNSSVGSKKHHGTDYRSADGSPLYAPYSGIAYSGYTESGGYFVLIDHENGYYTCCRHMQRNKLIKNNTRVEAGEFIGNSGNTGTSTTGAHLHFEMAYCYDGKNNRSSYYSGITGGAYNWGNSKWITMNPSIQNYTTDKNLVGDYSNAANTLEFRDIVFPATYRISNSGWNQVGGIIVSDAKIVEVKSQIVHVNFYNDNKDFIAKDPISTTKTPYRPNAKLFSVFKLDNDSEEDNGVKFSYIKDEGNYIWYLTAEDEDGTIRTLLMPFKAVNGGKTKTDKINKESMYESQYEAVYRFIKNSTTKNVPLVDGTSIKKYKTTDLVNVAKVVNVYEGDTWVDRWFETAEGTYVHEEDVDLFYFVSENWADQNKTKVYRANTKTNYWKYPYTGDVDGQSFSTKAGEFSKGDEFTVVKKVSNKHNETWYQTDKGFFIHYSVCDFVKDVITTPAEEHNSGREVSTITWLNDDGSLIDTTVVDHGKVPTHEAPTKEGYTFSGWTPEVVAVTGPATYQAVFTETAEVISGKCGDNLTWTFSNGILTISGTGEMYDYEGNGPFRNLGVTSVVISKGATSIGNCAFQDCGMLTSISIPDTVTHIGTNAFAYTSRLESISIPDSVTYIGPGAFYECQSLKNVQLPKHLTSINEYTFYRCTSLTGINVPNEVTEIGNHVFYYCNKMTNVTLSNKLKRIGDWAFYACNSLPNITIPDSVTTIGKSAFLHSQGLSSIAIPANVTQIGEGAFAGCRKMTAINVAADNRYYCSIEGVLFNKAKTELIRYPSGRQGEYAVPEGVTTIANTAFYVNLNLTKVTLPESVSNIGSGAFSDCYNLNNVTILNKAAQIGEKAFYVYLDTPEHWNDKVTVYCYEDSTAHKYAIENNVKYSLLTSDPTVTEAPQTDLYFTYSGEGQDYVKTSNENKEFSVKRAVEDEKTFSLFTGIQVDGKNVDKSNYEAKAGSVVIKLKAPYLETLAVGDHVMTVLFTDGKNDIPFTVSAAETPVKPIDPTKFADVAVPSASFTFKKVWQGDHENSIDFTLYKADGSVYHHGFDKRVVSKTEWRYNAYFSAPAACYVIEKPVPGYQIKYVNVGVYADVTDRCCDGGTIINKKVPKTGDAADFALWAGIIALGVVGLTTTVILTKRKKAHK